MQGEGGVREEGRMDGRHINVSWTEEVQVAKPPPVRP